MTVGCDSRHHASQVGIFCWRFLFFFSAGKFQLAETGAGSEEPLGCRGGGGGELCGSCSGAEPHFIPCSRPGRMGPSTLGLPCSEHDCGVSYLFTNNSERPLVFTNTEEEKQQQCPQPVPKQCYPQAKTSRAPRHCQRANCLCPSGRDVDFPGIMQGRLGKVILFVGTPQCALTGSAGGKQGYSPEQLSKCPSARSA